MNQSPESKALRDLVTQIKNGKKPDITAAENLLSRTPLDETYISNALQRANNSNYDKNSQIRIRALNTEKAKRIQRARHDLHNAVDAIYTAARVAFSERYNALEADARAGKLTKKQFDQAIKDLCK